MNNIILHNAGSMLWLVVLACIIVLLAMFIDLCSGLHKAKLRGEVRSSWGLKRSLSKFIMYEGGMLIAAGIDLLIQLSNVLAVFNVEQLYGIPFITCLLGVFLLVVEFFSIREKADEKTRTELSRVQEVASRMVTKEELVHLLADVIKAAKDNSKD